MNKSLFLKRRNFLAVPAVLAGIGITRPAHAQGALEKIKSQGFVSIGFANEAPFSYATPSGELEGLDIDILHVLFDKIGVKDFRGGLTTFGSLIPGLKAGRFDLIASAIYIKPDRCAQVAFGEPMYIEGDGLVVMKGNPHQLHSYEDIAKDPALKVAHDIGATGVSDHAKAMGVKDSQLVADSDFPSGVALLKSGRVQAYMNTASIIATLLRNANDSSVEQALPFIQPVVDQKPLYGICSFAVNLQDKDLLNALNESLLAFRRTPEYAQLLAKYGMTASDMVPAGVTTEKACQGTV